MDKGAKAFLLAVGLCLASGIVSVVGVNASFGRTAGSWANYLVLLGVVLLIAAGLLNWVATVHGVRFLVQHKRAVWGPVIWWFPFSAVLTLLALGGLVAMTLKASGY